MTDNIDYVWHAFVMHCTETAPPEPNALERTQAAQSLNAQNVSSRQRQPCRDLSQANNKQQMRQHSVRKVTNLPGMNNVHAAFHRGDCDVYMRYMADVDRKLAHHDPRTAALHKVRGMAAGLVVPSPISVFQKQTCLLRAELSGLDLKNYAFFGETLLHQAAKWPMRPAELSELFDYLLMSAIDVNAKDATDSTPAHYLRLQDDPREALSKLLARGASLNEQDGWGYTATHRLASHKTRALELLTMCAAHGADLRAVTPRGETTLHMALANSNCDIPNTVRYLLENGVCPNQRDYMDFSARDYAVMRGQPASAALLDQWQARLDFRQADADNHPLQQLARQAGER